MQHTTYSEISSTNQTKWGISGSLENEAGKTFNGHCYIFNANNSSEYTFITIENVYLADDGTMLGGRVVVFIHKLQQLMVLI